VRKPNTIAITVSRRAAPTDRTAKDLRPIRQGAGQRRRRRPHPGDKCKQASAFSSSRQGLAPLRGATLPRRERRATCQDRITTRRCQLGHFIFTRLASEWSKGAAGHSVRNSFGPHGIAIPRVGLYLSIAPVSGALQIRASGRLSSRCRRKTPNPW